MASAAWLLALAAAVSCSPATGRREQIIATAERSPSLNSFTFAMEEELTFPGRYPIIYKIKGQYSYPDRVWTEITSQIGEYVGSTFVILRFGKGNYLKLPPDVRERYPGVREWIAGKASDLRRTHYLGLLPDEIQDVTQTLSFLRDAGPDVEESDFTGLDENAINYVIHYAFGLDPEKLSQSAAIGRHGFFEAGSADLWVGVDDVVRNLHLTLLGPAEPGGASRLEVMLSMFDYNKDVSFRAPPQEKVTPFEEFRKMYPAAAAGDVWTLPTAPA